MTEDHSHFDSEVQKVATEKNGGAVTKELFWGITVALGKDVTSLIEKVDASNAAGELRHASTLRMLEAHEADDVIHRREQTRECAETHTKLMGSLTRRAPRRSTDPADAMFAQMGRDMADPPDSMFGEHRESAFPDKESVRSFAQILAAWSFGKKVLAVIGTALIFALVSIVLSYSVASFVANRAESAGIRAERTMQPTPTVTVTATPNVQKAKP